MYALMSALCTRLIEIFGESLASVHGETVFGFPLFSCNDLCLPVLGGLLLVGGTPGCALTVTTNRQVTVEMRGTNWIAKSIYDGISPSILNITFREAGKT
jgi:hypothetical protein